jgi:carbon-monoxide dehydrogenase medium subunit
VLQSTSGNRTVSADDFFIDFYTTAMKPNEVLTEIRVPLPTAGSGAAYVKLPHPASGYVVVSAGALITRQASGSCALARVVLGGLGSGPVRAVATETELQGKPLTPEVIIAAAAKAAEETDPEGDTYASAEYKRHVATVYARRAIEAAVRRSPG